MLAAVVKKVGIYALIRLYFTVFATATLPAGLTIPGLSGSSFLAFFGPVLFVMALASMLFGGLAATGRDNLGDLLAYSSIGQVGFIALPLAVGATVVDVRAVGVAAALVYSFNHALSKGLLFLLTGTVRATFGTVDFDRLGGIAPRSPVLSAAFFVGGLSLVGIPPLLGFFGKLFVFRTAARAYAGGAAGAGLAAIGVLVGAVLTIAYISRAWNLVFWGPPSDVVTGVVPDRWSLSLPSEGATDGGRQLTYGSRYIAGEVAILVALAVAIVAFGIGIEFVIESARAGAEAALDTTRYVEAVDPPEVRE
jgi:multicomponent Na+:H+ antiporter subunit D